MGAYGVELREPLDDGKHSLGLRIIVSVVAGVDEYRQTALYGLVDPERPFAVQMEFLEIRVYLYALESQGDDPVDLLADRRIIRVHRGEA